MEQAQSTERDEAGRVDVERHVGETAAKIATPPNLIPDHLSPEMSEWLATQLRKGRQRPQRTRAD